MHRPTDDEIEKMIMHCELAMKSHTAMVAELRRLRAVEALAGQALVAKFHAPRKNPYTFDGRPICRPL